MTLGELHDDPDNVKLEKALVLLYIIGDRVYLGSAHESGISPIYASILYCSYWWKMSMRDIARINNVTKSTATHYVDHLEKKGFLRRVREDGDRRNIFVELTEQGKKWVESNDKKMERFIESQEPRFTPKEWKTLVSLLSKLVGGLETTPYDKLMENVMKMEF